MSNPLLIVIAGPNGAGSSDQQPRPCWCRQEMPFPSTLTRFAKESTWISFPGGGYGSWQDRPLADGRPRTESRKLRLRNDPGNSIPCSSDCSTSPIRLFLPARIRVLTRSRLGRRTRRGSSSSRGSQYPRRDDPTRRVSWSGNLVNFFDLYLPLADIWSVYDTTHSSPIRLIAEGIMGEPIQVEDPVPLAISCKKGQKMSDNEGREGILSDPDSATGEQKSARPRERGPQLPRS